ncbi:sugar kinase [Levilactobacillus namurensis]|uniref:sugar kinase n=1 Tax=Levilactobacillus namurensis TaxID=380393 RepID=UPI0026EC41A2|nr:sugar kinase [Levilactobacillus namurensis]
MSEFITMGEPLVIFAATQIDSSLVDATNFDKTMGGAELNVAIGVSRLHHSTQYISQVGDEPLGAYVEKTIQHHHVGTKYLRQVRNLGTGHQFKQLVSHGDPGITYYRKNSAASKIETAAVDQVDLSDVRIGHLSGIFAAVSEETLTAEKRLMQRLTEKGALVTFDPNLRPQLWPNQTKMIQTINELATHADVILPGIGEGKILTGYDTPEDIANFYLSNRQTKAVIVKVGPKGSYVKARHEQGYFVSGFHVEHVVDTVGAGDGFALGVISALLEHKSLKEAALRGNAIGALQVQTPGDNDGYPTPEQLALFYQRNQVVISS